jgi:hypothetical protein
VRMAAGPVVISNAMLARTSLTSGPTSLW